MSFRFKDVLMMLALAAVYFSLALLGLKFATVEGNVTMIWPASGAALAALLLYGKHLYPGVFIGAFAAGIYVGDSFWLSAQIAAGNTLEPLAALWLLQRTGFSAQLHRLRDLFLLLGFGGFVATLASTLFGVSGLFFSGFIQPAAIPQSALYWWLGDTMGIVLLTPALLVWQPGKYLPSNSRRMLEAGCLSLLAAMIGLVSLGGWPGGTLGWMQKGFWIAPLMVWAALRFGRRGVSALMILTFIQSLWGVAHDTGFFGHDPLNVSLLNMWVFHIVYILSGMTLAIVLAERHELQLQALDRESLLRGVIDSINDKIYFIDRDMRLIGCNEAVQRLLMKSEAEIIGKHVSQLLPGDVLAQLLPMTDKVITHGLAYRETMNLAIGETGAREYDVQKLPLRNAKCEIIGVITVARDVTEEARLQRELAHDRAMLRGVMDGIPDLIFFKNVDGVYLGCNKAFEQFFGAEEK